VHTRSVPLVGDSPTDVDARAYLICMGPH
jgi:hypothetical protein